ncbi:DNA-binding response regulator, OmpR family, contains REC and winged-helix (wHTH) domain [Paenibacillus algorifonticola]|uniref:DNA-binding response regulator, OmpR family, contains REC and winged-helix (WHTH) domain n=1 Tax=Paenibacillus algorifonticola TaxID=684063 RepID=A0A1I2IVZ3_9BACL|nr:response regulator transcription factor [Paenibacillus algorifonticola]SFF45793.1 DNA-binding response regulator, OmpR family, contains REC and winged-helix (wHTH) domain [Paenibacillus algorifonticola]
MYTIMIVEDDAKIAELLRAHIEKYGNAAVVTTDFARVMEQFEQVKPHIVLMDINLPSFDGFYWCRQIRTVSTCPIIFISARSGEMDTVRAIENGGDDYLTKPFHYEVVMAKIRSQLRRVYGDYAQAAGERMVEHAGLILYPERMELHLQGQFVALTKKETVLVETLLQRCQRLVSRETILEKLWDDYTYVDDNALSVNMSRVRKKLAELGIEGALETVRGTGYRLNDSWANGEQQSERR